MKKGKFFVKKNFKIVRNRQEQHSQAELEAEPGFDLCNESGINPTKYEIMYSPYSDDFSCLKFFVSFLQTNFCSIRCIQNFNNLTLYNIY